MRGAHKGEENVRVSPFLHSEGLSYQPLVDNRHTVVGKD